MFGYEIDIRKFLINWTIILVALATGAVGALGFNSITRSFSLIEGFKTLGDLFGGLGNLLGVLILFVAIIAVFLGAQYIAKNDLSKYAKWIGFGSALALVATALIGIKLVAIDGNFSRTAMTVIVVIVIVTVAATLITPPTKKPKKTATQA